MTSSDNSKQEVTDLNNEFLLLTLNSLYLNHAIAFSALIYHSGEKLHNVVKLSTVNQL